MLKPYIGVAGFTSTAEMLAAIETLPQGDCTHHLALGILASQKTFDGRTHSKPNRYPSEGAIEKIVAGARKASTQSLASVEFILHMALSPKRDVDVQVQNAVDLVRDVGLDGIQFNASPCLIIDNGLHDIITSARQRAPTMKRVIMQLRPARDDEPRLDWIGAGIKIVNSGVATDILIDASAGNGIQINFVTAGVVIAAIRGAMKHRYSVGFNVAGGLRTTNLGGVAELMEVHGLLGFDVESGVRDKQDRMDLRELRSYLYHAWTHVGASGVVPPL